MSNFTICSKNMHRIVWFVLLTIGCSATLFAQNKLVKFDHLTTREGLSQNKIFDIIQDRKGFIWIATEDGLNRYDGYNFKIFKNIPGDKNSLVDNAIRCLFLSDDSVLWTGGYFSGLSRFNPETENFENFLHQPNVAHSLSENFVCSISQDEKGNLWVGTKNNGIDYFNRKSGTFTHFKQMLKNKEEIFPAILHFVHQDSKERLWLGIKNQVRVFKISYDNQDQPVLSPIKHLNKELNSTPASILEDRHQVIWLGTTGNGLFYLKSDSDSLQSYGNVKVKKELASFHILDMVLSDREELWLAGMAPLGQGNFSDPDGPGLLKLDLKNQTVKKYFKIQGDANSLTSNNILSVFIDRTRVLWVGTFLSGVNKFDPSRIKFRLFRHYPDGQPIGSVRGFYLDKRNTLWAATADGLFSFNKKNGQFKRFKHDSTNENTISSDVVRCIHDDGKYLWVGTLHGLNRLNPKTNAVKRFYLNPDNPNDIINSVNYDIFETNAFPDYLWFGSNGGGLVRFNKITHQFKSYIYDSTQVNSFNNRDNFVRTVWWSPKRPDEIWTGTTHGINILNVKSGQFRYYVHDINDSTSLSHQNVMQFYEDEEGYVWVATYGGGLNRFDPKTETFLRFTEENSALPNNAVYSILPDKSGNLWLATNKGICKFNKRTFRVKSFSVDDGLQSEEFNGGSHYLGRNGEMFFGGIKGFNSFFPEEISENQYLPEMVITGIKIFGKSYLPPNSGSLYNLKRIQLAYWQNDLSFDYVGLHFANPQKNTYAFKLENYDHNWRYVKNLRQANYTNLDPGTYVFRVKAANNDGIWNEHGKSIYLTILPPWWRTYWAYLAYMLAFMVGVITIDRMQRKRLLAREKRKTELALLESENRRKSEELEEARRLQLSMLPKKIPQLPDFDIAVFMETATEVGGDYYDFFLSLDGTLTIAIGDATGHGMRAGTMVTVAKSLFQSHASNPDILSSFREMTRCIKQMHMEKMSMCLTMLKIKDRAFRVATAGMPPLLIFRDKTKQIEEHLFEAMPLGTLDNFPYEMRDIRLEDSDTILLMSDGLPELTNFSDEMYGYDRIKKGFAQVAQDSPEEIISWFRKQREMWSEDHAPNDDVTIIALKVKSKIKRDLISDVLV